MISMTVLAMAMLLPQDPPPAPPAPPAPSEIRTRVMVMGGPGGAGMDTNGDGEITRDEFAAPMNAHFAQMDTNGDGRLSSDEMQARHGDEAGAHAMHMRHGAPGAMTWTRSGEGRTVVMDGREIEIETTAGTPGGTERRVEWTSEDGTQRQVVVIRGDGPMPDMPMPPPPPAGPRGPDGHGAPHMMMMGSMGGPGGNGGHMMRMENQTRDSDGDGKVSLAEFTAPLAEVFTRLDTNHDGFLDDSERNHGRRVVVVAQSEFREDDSE